MKKWKSPKYKSVANFLCFKINCLAGVKSEMTKNQTWNFFSGPKHKQKIVFTIFKKKR